MAEAHLDHPGEISWFKSYGPLTVVGACPHDCKHMGTGVIAWGPSMERYELIECGMPGDTIVGSDECAGRCRAWTDSRGRVVTPWMMIEP